MAGVTFYFELLCPTNSNKKFNPSMMLPQNCGSVPGGEHMHHGYYGPQGNQSKERRQAQIDLIDECLGWANVTTASDILDCGCGIGGSALVLAERFQARVVGITLSPVQAGRAIERARAAGLDGNTPPCATFEVANALHTPFPDQSFDFIWSMESGEHMPDKVGFLRECYRLLKPGGKLLMATWCHRPTDSLAGPLTKAEQQQLDWIYQVYGLPYVIALPDYATIAQNCGFTSIQTADWSQAVAPLLGRGDSLCAYSCDGDGHSAGGHGHNPGSPGSDGHASGISEQFDSVWVVAGD
jgi:tocopherol O-methyltransferase